METIFQKERTSRKDRRCNGCDLYLSEYNWNDFTFSQKKKLLNAARDGFKILKGQKYISCTVVDSGDIWRFNVRLDIDLFLHEEGIYEEVNQYI